MARTRLDGEALFVWGAIALYACVTLGTFNIGYVDFGDGNYLYISSRMADGLVLYRDIVCPQPPVHLLAGSSLVHLSRFLGARIELELFFFRVYLVIIHSAIVWVLWRISRHLFPDRAVRSLGILLYILLPNTYLWSRGFQSENHEILFLLLTFLFLLWRDRKGLILAAAASVLGVFTNMTFVPFLVLFVLHALWTHRREALWYVVPMVLLAGALLFGFEIWSGGHYLENVFFNQVGTFPRGDPPLWVYAIHKFLREGGDLLGLEGGFIIAAFLGLVVLAGQRELTEEHGLVMWFSIFSLGSIVFVAKGGTEEYIFTLGEPMVALLAASFLHAVFLGSGFALSRSVWRTEPGTAVIRLVLVVFFGLTLFGQAGFHLYRTVRQQSYELGDEETIGVARLISEYAPSGGKILAPPYYAYLTGTRLCGELSETFVWYIRYKHGEDYGPRDPAVYGKIEEMVDEIENGAVRIAFLNNAKLGRVPQIRRAVERNFERVYPVTFERQDGSRETFFYRDSEVRQLPAMRTLLSREVGEVRVEEIQVDEEGVSIRGSGGTGLGNAVRAASSRWKKLLRVSPGIHSYNERLEIYVPRKGG